MAERSTMSTYLSGESFEVPQNMIGFILEGFIKTQGTLEIITAPAALFSSYADRSFRVSEIAGNCKSIYNIHVCGISFSMFFYLTFIGL